MDSIYRTPPEPVTVALVRDPENPGVVYDLCWNWESGQNYAQSGYVVEAVAPDGSMSVDEAQRLYDYERRCFIDCWGRDTPFHEA